MAHHLVGAGSVPNEEPEAVLIRQLQVEEAERRRIARELHDSTGQHLAAISLLLRRLRDDTGLEPGISAILEQAGHAAGEALKELRSFSYLLHPPIKRDEDLPTALRYLVEGYAHRVGLPISVEIAVLNHWLLRHLDVAILRITQEALANVHRHAAASRARVRLEADLQEVRLVVEDDGRGIGVGAERYGVGITAMRARAEMLGGHLYFVPVSKGTRLNVRIPIGRRRAAA